MATAAESVGGTGAGRERPAPRDRPRVREVPRQPPDGPHRAALARADDRPLPHLAAGRRRTQREGLVEGLQQAEPRHLAELLQILWNETNIPHSLVTTAEIAIGGHGAADHRRRAGGLRVRLARLPGPRLALHRRDRPARRAAPDGADPDLRALQQDSGSSTRSRGLVLFHTAFGLPFAIFLLRNFFIGIPKDILESARIDGCVRVPDLRRA